MICAQMLYSPGWAAAANAAAGLTGCWQSGRRLCAYPFRLVACYSGCGVSGMIQFDLQLQERRGHVTMNCGGAFVPDQYFV
jgi:hypothetical protein